MDSGLETPAISAYWSLDPAVSKRQVIEYVVQPVQTAAMAPTSEVSLQERQELVSQLKVSLTSSCSIPACPVAQYPSCTCSCKHVNTQTG